MPAWQREGSEIDVLPIDLKAAYANAHRPAVVASGTKLGRVEEQGSKQEVLSPPHPPYTELLLSSVPEMDPDWLTHVLQVRRRPYWVAASLHPGRQGRAAKNCWRLHQLFLSNNMMMLQHLEHILSYDGGILVHE